MFDICIIGGGASGMTAAITAAETAEKIHKNLNILILEKKDRMGKKIIVSGNGKCNLSNLACENYKITKDFFEKAGLVLRSDSEGRVYPYTEESKAVYNVLKNRIDDLGIKYITDAEVISVEKKQDFNIFTKNRKYTAEKLLIATGGKSAPSCGTTGDGFKFARQFGHTVSKLIPVLTAVETEEKLKDCSGIRAKGKVILEFQNRKLFEEQGEIQFTKTGISGICVFNLSRFLLIPEGCSFKDGFKDYKIYIDFIPDVDSALEFLLKRKENTSLVHKDILKYVVKDQIAELIYKESEGNINKMAELIKRFPLTPVNVRGWDFAQVTKGGVLTDEINMETMESRLVKNLYFAGEVTDFDGPCGGFNLQNAWETGIKAGKGLGNE